MLTDLMYVNQVSAWFKKLQMPKWVDVTEHCACAYGVPLIEVALTALTEGS